MESKPICFFLVLENATCNAQYAIRILIMQMNMTPILISLKYMYVLAVHDFHIIKVTFT